MKISDENKKDFINIYEKFYYSGANETKEYEKYGIPKNLHTTSQEIEKSIERHLENGVANRETVLWKFGRLNEQTKNDISNIQTLRNGYGNSINAKELDDYLKELKRPDTLFESDEYIKSVFNDSTEAPKNFGTVYIISVLYFLSKGVIPLYDKFAHKAVKALYYNKSPNEIYVDSAPAKEKVLDVLNLINEYKFLLEKLFGAYKGTYEIDRELDRALWVYGHATKKWECDI